MQVPIWSHRMKQKFAKPNRQAQVVHGFAYGQKSTHQHITGLHYGIRNEDPHQCMEKIGGSLVYIKYKAGNHQEAWHVKSIYELFGRRIHIAKPREVKHHHQYNKHSLCKVQFIGSFSHRPHHQTQHRSATLTPTCHRHKTTKHYLFAQAADTQMAHSSPHRFIPYE